MDRPHQGSRPQSTTWTDPTRVTNLNKSTKWTDTTEGQNQSIKWTDPTRVTHLNKSTKWTNPTETIVHKVDGPDKGK